MEEFLKRSKKAVLFLEETGEDCFNALSLAKDFFAGYGVELQRYVMCMGPSIIREDASGVTFLHKSNVNLFGRFRHNRKTPEFNGDEDIFISLLSRKIKAVNILVRDSRAFFKAGRKQIRGGGYNVVVTDPENVENSQDKVLETVLDILKRVV